MLRVRLALAASAAALIAGSALAQDPPLPETSPETAPVPESPTVPEPEPQVRDVEAATATGTPVQSAPIAQSHVMDVLRADGQFSTLVSALEAAGLANVLETDPDITIFAPTDAAFAALPAGEVERLTQPQNVEELRRLLLYHVINADVREDQILNRRGSVMTGGGAEILLDGADGRIRADGATVTRSDLRGSNGAVFVIDRVLDPSTSMADPASTRTTPEAPPASTTPDSPPPPTESPEPTASPPPGPPPLERPPGESPPIDDAPDEDPLNEPGGSAA